jgi:hypothetical protein
VHHTGLNQPLSGIRRTWLALTPLRLPDKVIEPVCDFGYWHEPEGRRLGGACLLRPGISDVNLFRYSQGVIYFNTQISDGAFDLRVPERKLDRSEISRAPIDQGRFGASQ